MASPEVTRTGWCGVRRGSARNRVPMMNGSSTTGRPTPTCSSASTASCSSGGSTWPIGHPLPIIGNASTPLAITMTSPPRSARMGDVSRSTPLFVPERGPRLFLVHRRDGEMGAVHDHKVWLAIHRSSALRPIGNGVLFGPPIGNGSSWPRSNRSGRPLCRAPAAG